MDSLFTPLDNHLDTAVPQGVELSSLPVFDVEAAATSGYARRGTTHDDESEVPPGDLVMVAVGYTTGDRSPEAYQTMKASALAWFLDRKQYIKMQNASNFISESDSGMLTSTFPHLEPWGIGGFFEPLRTKSQFIPFERQKD